MRYIDTWLSGLGLEYIIPKLKDNGITTPKQLATLSLREIYEVVGVEDSDDRKKLYFLIQRLQTILQYKPPLEEDSPNVALQTHIQPSQAPQKLPVSITKHTEDNESLPREEDDIRVLRKNRRASSAGAFPESQPKQRPKEGPVKEVEERAAQPPPIPSQPSFPGIEDMPIRVVIRKRPLSKNELAKGDRDIMEIRQGGVVMVHEPKTKVDLTRVVETQTFIFDDAFEASESNELIYCRTVKPLVDFIFSSGKATCFAYGQTGSGKTFSMMGSCPEDPSRVTTNAGLYVLAARDIFSKVHFHPHLKVVVSCFEIYGTKLFDLLNSRNPIKCLEDSKQQVQLPGLTEHVANNVMELLEMMRVAHSQRSTGSTGANAESSRSHQILQLLIKDSSANRKRTDVERKLSFIDLAGSERGADTVHSSKQTRLEGAEINTSLLALKEVIRSLEKKQSHTPFRGSKLTQVLKDSFVGSRTRTCMLACVSPSQINCEHTLNTLRYADRVKEHQASSNPPSADLPSSNEALVKPTDHTRPRSSPPSNLSENDKDPIPDQGFLDSRRKSISQPALGFPRRAAKDSSPMEKVVAPLIPRHHSAASHPKTMGKSTGNGVVVNRVTEKLKDMNESIDAERTSSLNEAAREAAKEAAKVKMMLGLLSAHKLSIAEMVEVMKDEMEMVQEMENVDDRNTEAYLNKLDGILEAKKKAITTLRNELRSFQNFRSTTN